MYYKYAFSAQLYSGKVKIPALYELKIFIFDSTAQWQGQKHSTCSLRWVKYVV